MIPRLPPRLLIGIFWMSLFQLAFELFFVKLSYYQIGTLSHVFLGLAMLGVALAVPLSAAAKSASAAIYWCAIGAPLSAALAGGALFSLTHERLMTAGSILSLSVAAVGAVGFMSLSTLPFIAAIKHSPDRSHSLYAATLAGNAFGTLLGLGLGSLGDMPAFAIMVGACATFGAIAFAELLKRAAALAGAAALLIVCWQAFPRIQQVAHPDAVLIASDAFYRVKVVPQNGGSLRFHLGGVGGWTDTPGRGRTRGDTDLSLLLAPRRVLVLGSGAGLQVQEALSAGAESVTAVDINVLIPKAMKQLLPDGLNPYLSPKVRFLGDEIRQTVRREHDLGNRYDLIYLVQVLYSGQAFQQSYVQTRDAFEEYLDLLSPGGSVAVSHHFKVDEAGEVESRRAKIVAALSEAVRSRAIPEPEKHILTVAHKGGFLTIARPGAIFGSSDIDNLRLLRGTTGIIPAEMDLERARTLSPFTDDLPFLSTTKGRKYWWSGFQIYLLPIAGGLAVLAWMSSSFSLRASGTEGETRGYLGASVLLGMGYVCYQSILIQRLSFLLGHPVLATAVGLSGSLLATAAGSYWCRERPMFHRSALGRLGAGILLVWIVGIGCLHPRMLIHGGVPTVLRVLIALAATLPPFVIMGTFFPFILRTAAAVHPGLATRCWVMNGVASVYGSFLVVLATMAVGYQRSLLLPAAFYLGVVLWLQARKHHGAVAGFSWFAIAATALCAWISFR